MARILILAPPKSGTTILYEILRESLPPDTVCLFEPKDCAPSDPAAHAAGNVLSKVLLEPSRGVAHYGRDACDFFDRRIFIRRDPRDLLVSTFLYYNFHLPTTTRFHAFAELVAALKEKEHDPAGLSFVDLLALQCRLIGARPMATLEGLLQTLAFAQRVIADHGGDLFVLEYRDLVDRRLGALQSFLGLPVTTVAEVASDLRRVARTKGYGDWRNWFTASDVDLLRPRLAKFMRPDDDWELPAQPRIAPEIASGYLDRLARERGQLGDIDYVLDAIPPTRHLLGDPAKGRHAILLPGIASRRTEISPGRGAQIRDPHIRTCDGRRVNVLIQGESYTAVCELAFERSFPNRRCALTVMDRRGETVLRMATALHGADLDAPARSGNVRVEFDFDCHLAPDVYFANVRVASQDDEWTTTVLHDIRHAMVIVVAATEPSRPRITAVG